jgi:type VI secretion system protein ImpG
VDHLNARDELLEYYRRELAYLRDQGESFALRHPRVAQRLALSGQESPDPHTERLIESVAFLGARIHRDLDREFPRVASALLENLCPALAQPVPAMTVAQFALDASQGKVTAGQRVPRGTMLHATATGGEICRFRVAWETVLWPLEIGRVELADPRTLRIVIRCAEGHDLAELELDRLRLHLGGDQLVLMPLHELLLTALEDVELETGDGAVRGLGAQALREVGFDEGEEVLPTPAHAHPAYALLQEYFAFPRKFQFFDLVGLRGRLGRGREFALRLRFDRASRALASVGRDNLRLGCVPLVNVFERTSEPVRVDRQRDEYLLVADRRHEAVTEIHSVLAVIATDPDAARPQRVPSAYAPPAQHDESAGELSWLARREPSLRKGIGGTDTYLSFIDRSDVRGTPTTPIVYAQVLCTNRRLAEQIPAGTRLIGQSVSRSLRIRTLYEPSAERAAPIAHQALWQLVAMLRLNHRSLIDDAPGGQALRDMLSLFAGERARDQAQIRGLLSLRAEPGTARVGRETWRGHCRGTDVGLEFDPEAFAGGSPLLLAAVLSRFLALYTTANSFVRLRVLSRGELVKQWPAMSGRQCLL